MPANQPLVMGVLPYTPDMPSFGGGGSVMVKNVLPRTPKSYGPLSALAAYPGAVLPSRCYGAYSGADPADNVSIFAGTATDLYQIASSGTSFTNVSKSPAAYAVDLQWRFCIAKSNLIAASMGNPLQSFVLGTSSTFLDLSATAPQAKFCAAIKQWVMVANTSDPVGGVAPWRMWWSGINDATSWPTPGSATAVAQQSDYNDLSGENGAITGLVGNLGTSEGALFFEHAVWRIVYIGPPAVFDFFPAQGVKGTPYPNSIAQVGALVFYLAEDGFYAFDGTNATPIGVNRVDKTFFADLQTGYNERVTGAVDPINKMIFWAYPGNGSFMGNPNHLMIYNWATDRWAYGELSCEVLFRGLGLGFSLDGLDSLGLGLDSLPFSLDSSAWVGGALQIAAFDTNHNLAYFNGSALAASVDCEEIEPFNGQRTFVRNTRPLVDGGTPSVAIGTRELLTNPVMFNAGTPMNSLGWCPQRASARYTRARVTMPAASSFSHIIGVELDADPIGVR